jgi:hypothetical protein
MGFDGPNTEKKPNYDPSTSFRASTGASVLWKDTNQDAFTMLYIMHPGSLERPAPAAHHITLVSHCFIGLTHRGHLQEDNVSVMLPPPDPNRT